MITYSNIEKEKTETSNFIEEIIERDLAENTHGGRIHTRFPPEPNGYLHIGHAKSICLNFGLAQKYNGKCNLRFDDTNPVTEETEYVESILGDVRWLGFEPDAILYASDYFGSLYQFAIDLIKKGQAYVDDSSSEEMAAQKGTPTQPGTLSPYRNRSVEENLDLFTRMKNGEFPEGSRVLRAKIDMASPNMIMRDPVLYRIKFAHHHRTGDDWCIYPMYDMAHGQSDSIEKITHSICTLEFMPHRELYDWCIENLEIFPSKQYEFARLNVTYTVMSKRKLLQLVNENYVNGWDDPRMPTITGMRRRGYTAAAIRNFATRVGVAKRENIIDLGLLEFCVREDLNKIATRAMAVLDPLKVVITNYPENQTDWLETENNPEAPEAGTRQLPFSRELWIEQEDFMENPPPKFFRLSPGSLARLKSAYIIRCDEAVKDAAGQVTELRCTYFPESRSGQDTSGLKPKTTIHWVSAPHAIAGEIRLYDRLLMVENAADDPRDFKELLNPDSLKVVKNAWLEPSLADVTPNDHFQFIRLGYFTPDSDTRPGQPVFNRTVTLKDAWAKIAGKN
jgi:glutaminyl-tRNA synthetase